MKLPVAFALALRAANESTTADCLPSSMRGDGSESGLGGADRIASTRD
jgi:hypothetical protein